MSAKFAQLLIKENIKKRLINKESVKNQPKKSIKVDWRTDKKKRLNIKDKWIS